MQSGAVVHTEPLTPGQGGPTVPLRAVTARPTVLSSLRESRCPGSPPRPSRGGVLALNTLAMALGFSDSGTTGLRD